MQKQQLRGRLVRPTKRDRGFWKYYAHPHGVLWQGDAVAWLKSLPDESVDVVFGDPPYNLQAEQWDKLGTDQEYLFWTIWWVKEAVRVLKPKGSLYLCGFSEQLGMLYQPVRKLFADCRWLVWHYKNKANLRQDWGRAHESVLHLRRSKEIVFRLDPIRVAYNGHTLKYPVRSQAKSSRFSKYGNLEKHPTWAPHPQGAKPRDVLQFPTVNNGGQESTLHPAQKPEELVRRLLLAVTSVGDVVVDPFLGSGTTAVVCEQLERRWLGCEQVDKYLQVAIERIESVQRRGEAVWIAEDRKRYLRRE